MDAESRPPRKILHLDLDAFFCAVEEKHNAELRGKAFAVGGQPESRGVVASCSYAARKYGIHSAMPMAQARRLYSDLIIVSHGRGKYSEESREVMEIVRQEAPRVEQISIDEAFMDVTELQEPAEAVARRIQARIMRERKLPCSLGVATNKLVAKIATDFGKAQTKTDGPPNAVYVVPPGQEAEFLAPLPAKALWGVGPKTARRLAELGIHTIGDITRRRPDELRNLFGKHGESLARRARGLDDSPVEESHEVKSISREVTFARDISDQGKLHETLADLAMSVGRRLRKAELAGSTVKIKLRWSDFTTITRQTTLQQPTDRDEQIISTAVQLFEDNWIPHGRPVRLVGVGISGLESASTPTRQLSLWDDTLPEPGDEDLAEGAKKKQLDEAVSRLRERFGSGAIRRGGETSQGSNKTRS